MISPSSYLLNLALGDPKRLGQVLFNVLSSALQFTPKHGTILVTARSEDETELVHFEVSSNGIGISKKHMFSHLFQVSVLPFTHTHSYPLLLTQATKA